MRGQLAHRFLTALVRPSSELACLARGPPCAPSTSYSISEDHSTQCTQGRQPAAPAAPRAWRPPAHGPWAQHQTFRSIQGFARIAETESGMTKLSGYYGGGFYINNVQVPGSVLCSHDMFLMWRPRRMSEVTPESLTFLEVIRPAPEVLVLGCGSVVQPLPPAVREYLTKLDVKVELLDSRNATGYFNVLNDEGRAVVGALLVWDPDARVPEVMPEQQEPMWDRPGLLQRSGTV